MTMDPWDIALNILLRLVFVIAVTSLGLLAWCSNNDNSITDCSSRGRPQHYAPGSGRWTCGQEQQR